MKGSKLRPWQYEKWKNIDLQALIAYCSYYENIGMAEYLPKVAAPFLFYAGEEDNYPHSRAKACAEIIQNAVFVSLPGLNHSGASIGAPAALPYVLKFLERTTNR
jgi:pimeloyl-ACP methyl ester carboxylesterase